jgi:hypothetical protein
MNKNVVKVALVTACLVAAPVTWGLVNAQTAPGSSAQTTVAQAVNYASVFIQKLASSLGVTQEKLNSSITAASNATIDQALQNQDITRAQADQLKLDVQNGRSPFLEDRGFGRGGRGEGFGKGGMGDRGPGFGMFRIAALEAAAKALNTTATDLEAQFRAGQTLQQVATTKNVPLATVQAAVANAVQTQLKAEVTAGRLTQAQADELVARIKADPNAGLGFGGGRGGRGGFGPR